MSAKEKLPIIPFEYMCEMICDRLSAGIVYGGKKWTKEEPLNYWIRQRENFLLNDKLKDFLTDILTQVAENGIDKTINKRNLMECYKKHTLHIDNVKN